MMYRVILCLMLAGCSAYPGLQWPEGPVPMAPDLLPAKDLAEGPAGVAEARGAELAAQVTALQARAAAIGTD